MAAPATVQMNARNRKAQAPARASGHRWSDLFKSASKPSSSFKLQKWSADERGITNDELRNLGHCLVGFILGRFPGIQAIDQVRKSWQVESNISIHDSGWLIFSFANEEDRDAVLEKGPYESQGSAWILKKMPQFFQFDDECFKLIPTWIRLQGLPLDFWSANALGKIASFVGNPIAADECTAMLRKTSFARILVEVDVTKPLVREASFTMPNGSTFTQNIVYEREPRWCPHCRMVGHIEADCRRKKVKKSTAPSSQMQAADIVQDALHSAAQHTVAPAPATELQIPLVPNLVPVTGESSIPVSPKLITNRNDSMPSSSGVGLKGRERSSPTGNYNTPPAPVVSNEAPADKDVVTNLCQVPVSTDNANNSSLAKEVICSPANLNSSSAEEEGFITQTNARTRRQKAKGKGKAR